MFLNPRLILTVLILLAAQLVPAGVAAETYVPDDLQQWQQWVLKDKEYLSCPFYFDRAVDQPDGFECSWPGEIRLAVGASEAEFSQQWTVFAKEQWIALPGGVNYWPDTVTVNDRSIEVVARNNTPSVKLAPGIWRVKGRFEWDERPSILRVPSRSGLIDLVVDGRRVARPELNRGGVFLGERKRDTRARNSVRTVVHRLVADDLPLRLVTRLQIDVSGSVREEVFGPILPEGFIPVSIDSQLPAKLEADGKLHLQVRPGRWTITLSARDASAADSITRPVAAKNLAADEIWSYQPDDRLRVTAVEGLPPVDPSQVEVPGSWQALPAFRMDKDATFSIIERSRGVVAASNELGLKRTMWLDFGGGGFVVQDTIGGTMRTDWRLDMNGPYALLSAKEYGESLLITDGADDGLTGIEVRQSNVDVVAIGRAETRGLLPVTGWGTRFADVEMGLNLPPGHKLLMATGVDHAGGSWTSQWQLLDFFLVLIITIAVWRLFGRGAGLIALAALVLSFHELNAPAWLWLNLLITIALMRVAPAGWLRRLVSGYQALSAVALVIALVPFIAGQLRIAIYPQLEPQAVSHSLARLAAPATKDDIAALGVVSTSENGMAMKVPEQEADRYSMTEGLVSVRRSERRKFSRYAPNAIVQAGPGIPSWRWNSYSLAWSGPVDAEQTMRLVIMPRWLVSLMRVAAVVLLFLFAAVLAAEIFKREWTLPAGVRFGGQNTAAILSIGLLAGLMAASPQAEAQYPDTELLRELEQRLLEPPDCLPRCAEMVSADLQVSAETISMSLSVHALANVAIPLPGSAEGWRPEAISLDGSAGTRIIRASNNSLWVHLLPGRHVISLRGPVPAVDSLEIPFLTPPRVIRVESDGWFVAGIKDRRLISGSVQLTRLQSAAEDEGSARWESSRFPIFARVERTVEMDVDWRVRTTVYRVAPAQGALTLDIPLLHGENIVSGEFTITENRALVSMNPQQQSVSWTSTLALESPLTLRAGDGASWQEVWRFAVGNIWNADFSGIPQSNTRNEASGIRVAVFHPRPDESLTVTATRPAASEGGTLAFDSVQLSVDEGSRTRDTNLELRYRATRGSQHVIQLPLEAEVTSVAIDGREQTLRAQEGQLTLAILPGNHTIEVNWRENRKSGFRTNTPEVDIGAPASNISLRAEQSHDRWLLATSGPSLGPAVLYWSELTALIVFALILGRIKLTPLTTRHWLLLGLGFSTFSWPVLGLVIIWLMLCGAREKSKFEFDGWRFNLFQVVIAVLTVLTLANVALSLPAGLLGSPDMHVVGQSSYGSVLNWFADRSDSVLPVASAFTAPMWVYKVLILIWALWLSFALLRWLPWVWHCFSRDGYWRPKKLVKA